MVLVIHMVIGISHLKSSLTLKGLGGRGGGLCQGSGEVSPPAKRWVLAACTGKKEHARDNKKNKDALLLIFMRCERQSGKEKKMERRKNAQAQG